MSILKESHIIEDLNGIRCSIVEKNASAERVAFLKNVLECNGWTVVIDKSPPPPPPKVAPAAAPATPITEAGYELSAPSPPPSLPQRGEEQVPIPPPETFTIGVTDKTFHAMLAVYQRRLKTPDGKIISPEYWNQKAFVGNHWYWNL